MRCTSCGFESDQPAKFCPSCGAPMPEQTEPAVDTVQPEGMVQPVEPVQPVEGEFVAQPEQPSYVRPDYNPAQQSTTGSQPVYTSAQPKPSSTSQIVLAIINILCCGWGVAPILGIIALVFAIMSGSATSYDEAVNKLKTAKILNIIGIVITATFILVTIVGMIIGFATIPFMDSVYYEYGY